MDDDAIGVIRQAELIIHRARWRLLEEAAQHLHHDGPG